MYVFHWGRAENAKADCTFLFNYQLAEIMIIQLKLTNQMSTVPVKNDIFVGQTMDNK